MLARDEIKAAIEAMLFASGEPLPLEEIARVVGIPVEDTNGILNELVLEYNKSGHGIQVVEAAAGYSLCTKDTYYQFVKAVRRRPAKKLSQAALETLAIIAYQQPVTRAEIEAIRGVRAERMLNSLLARGLIAEAGRKEVPGRPVLYVTTPEFLKLFGMTGLTDLPREDKEA
ncbi:MAG: SMC-Scp complex subunit ScpB [Syntrophomonadaceae bacterium]|nr:SMC-Scp complex subunit ScpB [Syntrophomonadaceae bacterium]